MKTEARCRFDPSVGQRIGPAWVLILEALEDREWHSWSEVVSTLAPQTNLHPKTINNLLHNGVAHGYLARKGRHPRRRVRLISKNTSCECGAAK